jgi:hypothetical protein
VHADAATLASVSVAAPVTASASVSDSGCSASSSDGGSRNSRNNGHHESNGGGDGGGGGSRVVEGKLDSDNDDGDENDDRDGENDANAQHTPRNADDYFDVRNHEEDIDMVDTKGLKKSSRVGQQFQAWMPQRTADSKLSSVELARLCSLEWAPPPTQAADDATVDYIKAIRCGRDRPTKAIAHALSLLCKSGYDAAVARRQFDASYQPDEGWLEADVRMFERGLMIHGKDFWKIANLIRGKSVKDCVEFYYYWKWTDMHDAFVKRNWAIHNKIKLKHMVEPGRPVEHFDQCVALKAQSRLSATEHVSHGSIACISKRQVDTRICFCVASCSRFCHALSTSAVG